MNLAIRIRIRIGINILLILITIAFIFSNNKILAIIPFLSINIIKYAVKKYLIYKRDRIHLYFDRDKIVRYNKMINFINRDYYD